MTGEVEINETAPAPAPRGPWLRRIGLAVLGLLVTAALLLGGGILWLGTDSGRAFVARQISGFAFANGMTIHIGRIDGSIWSVMQVRIWPSAIPRVCSCARPCSMWITIPSITSMAM
jgi:translocation and assembly module TamB